MVPVLPFPSRQCTATTPGDNGSSSLCSLLSLDAEEGEEEEEEEEEEAAAWKRSRSRSMASSEGAQ